MVYLDLCCFKRPFDAATWPAYLILSAAYNNVFRAVEDKYRFAATNASASYPMWSSHVDPAVSNR